MCVFVQVGFEVMDDICDGDKVVVFEVMNMLICWICDLNFDGVD